MKKLHLLTALLIAISTACTTSTEEERWNPQLPQATQVGANTFGCKINGNIMIPRTSKSGHPGGGGYSPGVIYGYPNEYSNFDFIKAIDRVTARGGIAFKIPNLKKLGVGEYIVDTMVGGFVSTNPNVVYMGGTYKGIYYGSIKGKGKITITRYDEHVISGTFYGTLKSDYDPNKTIEVIDGRFDFNKETINNTKFN